MSHRGRWWSIEGEDVGHRREVTAEGHRWARTGTRAPGRNAWVRHGRCNLALPVAGLPVRIGGGFIVSMALLAFIPRGAAHSGSGSPGRWRCSRSCTSSATPSSPATPAPRRGSRSSSWPATRRSVRRPISRPMSIAISLAGPLTHIGAGMLVLVAMRYNPFDIDAVRRSEAALAIWFAGPVIGALNLLPVQPLDGGNVVTTIVDAAAPGRGDRIMTYVSTAVTAATLASAAFFDVTRQFVVFIAFLLLFQLSKLVAAPRPPLRRSTRSPPPKPTHFGRRPAVGARHPRRSRREPCPGIARQRCRARGARGGRPSRCAAPTATTQRALSGTHLIMQGQALWLPSAAGYEGRPGALPALAVARAAVLGDSRHRGGRARARSRRLGRHDPARWSPVPASSPASVTPQITALSPRSEARSPTPRAVRTDGLTDGGNARRDNSTLHAARRVDGRSADGAAVG